MKKKFFFLKRDAASISLSFVSFFFFEAEWQHIKFLDSFFLSLYLEAKKLFSETTTREKKSHQSERKRDGERE